jgi:hypothetical protein
MIIDYSFSSVSLFQIESSTIVSATDRNQQTRPVSGTRQPFHHSSWNSHGNIQLRIWDNYSDGY